MIDLNSIVDNLEDIDYLEDIDDLGSFEDWISKWDEEDEEDWDYGDLLWLGTPYRINGNNTS